MIQHRKSLFSLGFTIICRICSYCCTAKVHYGTSLSNVDWLHGGAESLLTLTNLFIVLGLREGLRKIESAEEAKSDLPTDAEQEKQSSI